MRLLNVAAALSCSFGIAPKHFKNIKDSDTGREKETKYPASPFIFQRLIPYVPRPKLIKG